MSSSSPGLAADIQRLMAQLWGLAQGDVPPDAAFQSLPQWDSLGHVQLLTALELHYSIEINFTVLTQLVSIPAIVDYLGARQGVRAADENPPTAPQPEAT